MCACACACVCRVSTISCTAHLLTPYFVYRLESCCDLVHPEYDVEEAERLDELHIITKGENTDLQAEIAYCLPKEPRTLAMSLLKRYDG